jgi:hypothetical protein
MPQLPHKNFLQLSRETFKGRHVSPPGFESWQTIQNTLEPIATEVAKNPELYKKISESPAPPKDFNFENAADFILSVNAYNFVATQAPAIYLDKKLGQALLRTDIPAIKDTPKLPFENFLVMFPEGLFPTGTGGEKLKAVLISNLPEEEQGFVAHGIVEKGKRMLMPTNLVHWYETSTAKDVAKFDLEFSESEEDYNSKMNLIEAVDAFYKNLILVYNSRPDLMYEEFFARPKKKIKADSNRMPVRILGRNYTPGVQRCVAVNKNRDVNNGTVMRAHWRRGHYHTVRHGKNHQERTLKWFEPVYVNFNKD